MDYRYTITDVYNFIETTLLKELEESDNFLKFKQIILFIVNHNIHVHVNINNIRKAVQYTIETIGIDRVLVIDFFKLREEIVEFVINIIIKQEIIIPENIMINLIDLINISHDNLTDTNLYIYVKQLLKHRYLKINEQNVLRLLETNINNDNYLTIIIEFIKKLNDINLSKILIQTLLNQNNQNKFFSSIYLLDNIPVDIECTQMIFSLWNVKLIKAYINKKFVPDNICWLNVINNIPIKTRKTKIPKGRLKNINNTFNEIVEVFINGGFVLTEQHVIEALDKNLVVYDFEKYGIEFSQKIKDKCLEKNINIIDKNMDSQLKFESMFLYIENFKIIESCIHKNNMIPNMQCLYNACLSGSTKMIRDVFKFNEELIPDKQCFSNVFNGTKNKLKWNMLSELTKHMKE